MKIMSVRVDDKFIELIPSSLAKYGDLFAIDSVSLLLGKNGAGKTRILTSLANAINSPKDESFQFYMSDTPNGHTEPGDRYHNHMCSIYYSALPYRRKISRRKGVFDASPKKTKSTDGRRLEKFGLISESLGIDARLEGVVSYTKTVFRTIITPVIRNSPEINQRDLKYLIESLHELTNTKVLNSSVRFSAYDKDEKRERILNEIEECIEHEFFLRFGEEDSFLFFSVLEFIYNNTGRSAAQQMAAILLVDIGLIDSYQKIQPEIDYSDILRYVENTKSIIDMYKVSHFDRNRRLLKFIINDINESKYIKNKDTVVQVEWSNQSSGIQALVEQFSLIDESVNKARGQGYTSMLLLIDEGDAYLHLDWQRKYVSLLNKFLGDIKLKYSLNSLQLVLATHSPLLAADIPGDFVTSLDSGKFTQTFAAPIEEIISSAFSSSTLGEFAAHKINEIYKRALSHNITSYDRKLIDSIGDVTIRAVLKKELSK